MSLPPSPAPSDLLPPDLYSYLDQLLHHGRIGAPNHKMLRIIIGTIERTSALLFPHSHVFREDIKREVQRFTYYASVLCGNFRGSAIRRYIHTQKTMRTLPNLIGVEEKAFYERLHDWRDRLQ